LVEAVDVQVSQTQACILRYRMMIWKIFASTSPLSFMLVLLGRTASGSSWKTDYNKQDCQFGIFRFVAFFCMKITFLDFSNFNLASKLI